MSSLAVVYPSEDWIAQVNADLLGPSESPIPQKLTAEGPGSVHRRISISGSQSWPTVSRGPLAMKRTPAIHYGILDLQIETLVESTIVC